MNAELIEILAHFHCELDQFEGELPDRIKLLFDTVGSILDEHDPDKPSEEEMFISEMKHLNPEN